MTLQRTAIALSLLLSACAQQSPIGNLEASYVGIDACAACHPQQAASFTQSQMGRSWELATLANSAADFDNPDPVYDAFNDLHYLPTHRGDSLYVLEYRLSGADTVHKRVERIDYIVGSGHHTNSHIMDVNGYLYQMPLTWYVQEGRWDLPPGFHGPNNQRFDRPIPLKCITCHNGRSTYVEGSENRYMDVPHGIDCERCHGPGSAHVELMRTGGIAADEALPDLAIVHPGRLPADRQFDICQGCHLQGAAVNRPGKTFADFRPGQRLEEIENVFWPRYADSLGQFVMASHPDRLRQSACFLESEAITCITCHDPHVPIEAMGENHYRDVCLSCHSAPPEPVCPTPDAAAGADCTSCHMPVSGSSDIPHVTITDHFIRSPDSRVATVADPEKRAEFVRMASLVDPSPSLTELAEGYLTYYETVTDAPGFLDSAMVYLREAERVGERVDALMIRTHFLRGEASAVVRIARNIKEVTDPWTAYRIGEAYLMQGYPEEARTYLAQAVEGAPEHLRFMLRLASAHSQSGHQLEAIGLFNRVLEANPKLAEAYNNRGFAHVLSGDAIRAESDFRSAISLDPDMLGALANLASLYLNLDRRDEARPLARRLLDEAPMNPQYRQLWEFVR